MDNLFTSPQLLEALLHQKTYGCGTVRLALKDMPEVFHGKNKKKVKKGDTAVYQRGNLVLTVWHDKRPVAILSSDVSPEETTEVRRHTKEPPYQKVVKVSTQVRKSTSTTCTWGVLISVTSFAVIILQEEQQRSGGNTSFGIVSTRASVMPNY